MSLLDARAIMKSFQNGDDTTTVLKGFDVRIEEGEMIALTGPSGSGKSTLLSILGLLMAPTSGTISVLGEEATALSERALSRLRNRTLGFVFQFHHLLPDFTAAENVAIPAAAFNGAMRASYLARAGELLDRVGLSDRINFRATKLSGGQKQRVAIARALMNAPRLVLMDEPTGNLDRESSDQVMALIRDIHTRDKTSFLICTHDEHIAAACERRIALADGRLAA
jgi:lipoprotein-releasing system ATP-binding protein